MNSIWFTISNNTDDIQLSTKFIHPDLHMLELVVVIMSSLSIESTKVMILVTFIFGFIHIDFGGCGNNNRFIDVED